MSGCAIVATGLSNAGQIFARQSGLSTGNIVVIATADGNKVDLNTDLSVIGIC
jgi:hypothetical protein